MSWWVLSPPMDILGFFLPLAVALALVPLTRHVPDKAVPLPYHVSLVVLIDVAHVYGTLFRTVLDSEATAKNRALFLRAPPCLFAGTMLVIFAGGEELGWSLLAYYAMYHFAKQPFGILCLYKARKGERGAVDHRIDYWTCMAGALIPVLIQHTDENAYFLHWFNNGERLLFYFPNWANIPLYVLYVLVPLFWFGRSLLQWRLGVRRVNAGKIWIMGVQYVSWYIGVLCDHEVRSLAFVNLFHGVSSMVLVYSVVQRRYAAWRKRSPATMQWRDKLCEAMVSSPWPYLAVMVMFAVVEDVSWEVCVYQAYLPQMGVPVPILQAQWRALVTALLMQPQLSHYFLDAYIWRMTPQNPGLKEAINCDCANR